MNRENYRPYWRYEHPDADLGDLPIPEDWEDASWKNDTMPSFIVDGCIRVWVDYADPHRREYGPDAPRFSVCHDDEDWHEGTEVGSTDDFGEVEALINKARRERLLDALRPTTEKVQAIASLVVALFDNPGLDLTLYKASEKVALHVRPWRESEGRPPAGAFTYTQWVEFLAEAGYDLTAANEILTEARGR